MCVAHYKTCIDNFNEILTNSLILRMYILRVTSTGAVEFIMGLVSVE